MTTPHPQILTVPSGYARRRKPENLPLLTLQLITPMALRAAVTDLGYVSTTLCGNNYWVINHRWGQPYEARCVTGNGRLKLWKRSMRLQLPWRYGMCRSASYGYFTSSDGLTWDPNNYAPYRLLSILDPLHPTDPNHTFTFHQLSLPIVEA